MSVRVIWLGSLMLGYIFEAWMLTIRHNLGERETLGIFAMAFIGIAFALLILENEIWETLVFGVGNLIVYWIYRPHLPPIQRELFPYIVAIVITAVFVHQARPGGVVNRFWNVVSLRLHHA